MASRRHRKNQPHPRATWPPLPGWHGLLSPIIAGVFAELHLSIGLRITDSFWHPIHTEPNTVLMVEADLGLAPSRWSYNAAQSEIVRQKRKVVRGQHGGLYDLFAPVGDETTPHGTLITGPFQTEWPSSGELRRRWYELTGLHGHLGDAQFTEYAIATLACLTLEGSLAHDLEKLVARFATLLCDQGDPSVLAREASELAHRLEGARVNQLMWDAAHRMVDARTAVAALGFSRSILATFGIESAPDQVMVGLFGGAHEGTDPLELFLQRAAFQRQCVKLALEFGGTVSGRVGEHGVTFLVADAKSNAVVTDLANKANRMARDFGFGLHMGVAAVRNDGVLPVAYRIALGAAEKAQADGVRVINGAPQREWTLERMRQVRERFEKSINEHPDLLMSRFDRYVDTILARSAFSFDVVRVELEVAMDRLVEAMLAVALADQKTLSELREVQERAATESRSVHELVAAYRRIVTDMQNVMKNPARARRERSTRRAVAFVRDHLSESLNVEKAARVAGLAPSHFAKLFLQNEGVPFATYVRRARVLRARDMLRTTRLAVEQIQRSCGFPSRATFYRVFKREVGVTPVEFRERN